MDKSPLHYQTLTDLAGRIRKGEITSTQLTENLLDRIDSLDGRLNAFKLLCPDQALEQARAADQELNSGKDLGILKGIPYAAKDLFDVKGLPTAAGSKLLESNIAAEDSRAIQSLAEAGMILAGKTHTVDAIVVDQQGKTVAGSEITIKAEYEETKASRVKGAGNAYITRYTHDWIEIDHDASLDLRDSMTISFWINPNSDSGTFNRVVEKGLWGYGSSYYFGGGNGTNDLTFYLNGQEVFDTPDNVLTVGEWQQPPRTVRSPTARILATTTGSKSATTRASICGTP